MPAFVMCSPIASWVLSFCQETEKKFGLQSRPASSEGPALELR